jgi:hypothetical protein
LTKQCSASAQAFVDKQAPPTHFKDMDVTAARTDDSATIFAAATYYYRARRTGTG